LRGLALTPGCCNGRSLCYLSGFGVTGSFDGSRFTETGSGLFAEAHSP
jgi:hypothetical protein